MRCPSEIAEIVCEILRVGLLRIRILDGADRARLEADHLHNLPSLLVNYKPELLDYYWQVERPCFMARGKPDDLQQFEPLWQALAQHTTAANGHPLAT